MSFLSRQCRPVELSVPASSVADAVTAIGGKHAPKILQVKVDASGRLRARVPATAYHSTPTLAGQLEAGSDGRVVLRGVIREPAFAVAAVRTYSAFGVLFLLLVIPQVSQPVPGGIVCLALGTLFCALGYGLGRGRTAGFSSECETLVKELTRTLPDGHRHVTLSPEAAAALAATERALKRITPSGRAGRHRNPLP